MSRFFLSIAQKFNFYEHIDIVVREKLGVECALRSLGLVYMMKKDGKLQNIYENQETWRKIMSFLPDSLNLKETALPQEEFWKWKDNDVHIDRYENPDHLSLWIKCRRHDSLQCSM